jgi:hypothetical protein
MLEHFFYETELKALNRNKIKYLVIGGLAVNLYGVHRFTQDLDLMIDLSAGQFEKFISIIAPLGYATKVPKNKWYKLNAITFANKQDKDKRIDVFLKNPLDFDRAYKRRKVFRTGKFQLSCVSLDDLLQLKDQADRLRDWIDIGSLKRVQQLKKGK